MSLRPQDLLVLYKHIASPEQAKGFVMLASALHMSLSQVHRSVERCVAAGLAHKKGRGDWQPDYAALFEFAVHGVPYAFATKLGPAERGVPTSFGVPPLANDIQAKADDIPVWLHPEGTVRGPSIEPLAKYVPLAALADSRLHELLALQDALRIGRARERNLAAKYLGQRLGVYSAGE